MADPQRDEKLFDQNREAVRAAMEAVEADPSRLTVVRSDGRKIEISPKAAVWREIEAGAVKMGKTTCYRHYKALVEEKSREAREIHGDVNQLVTGDRKTVSSGVARPSLEAAGISKGKMVVCCCMVCNHNTTYGKITVNTTRIGKQEGGIRMTKQYKSFTLPLASCTSTKDYQTLQIVWTQLKNIWVNQVWPEHILMTQETSKGALKGAWWKTYIHKTQITNRSAWGLGEAAGDGKGQMNGSNSIVLRFQEVFFDNGLKRMSAEVEESLHSDLLRVRGRRKNAPIRSKDPVPGCGRRLEGRSRDRRSTGLTCRQSVNGRLICLGRLSSCPEWRDLSAGCRTFQTAFLPPWIWTVFDPLCAGSIRI